jgi:putative membrane protein insertion efficiency factor
MKEVILKSIKFYRKFRFFHSHLFKILFLTDSVCRFSPTCSEYTYQAVQKYGAVRGVRMGIFRIMKCHPWSKGGYDPVK